MSDTYGFSVEEWYDYAAERLLAHRDPDDIEIFKILGSLSNRLTAGQNGVVSVLDIGCGAGIPATEWLANRYQATGIDISSHQIALARQYVPGATLIKGDIFKAHLPNNNFDAIVSFYVTMHFNTNEVGLLMDKIRLLLKPNGCFAANWLFEEYEKETLLSLLESNTFEILEIYSAESQNDNWWWTIVRKR